MDILSDPSTNSKCIILLCASLVGKDIDYNAALDNETVSENWATGGEKQSVSEGIPMFNPCFLLKEPSICRCEKYLHSLVISFDFPPLVTFQSHSRFALVTEK